MYRYFKSDSGINSGINLDHYNQLYASYVKLKHYFVMIVISRTLFMVN